MQQIVNGGPGSRSDHADAAGKRRQRTFALRVEEPFGGKTRLALFEGHLQTAHPSRLQRLDNKLDFATLRIYRQAPPGNNLHAVLRTEAEQPVLHPEHHPPQLRPGILQTEIPVAGGGGGKIRNLPFDQNLKEIVLDDLLQQSDEPRDAENLRRAHRQEPYLVLLH